MKTCKKCDVAQPVEEFYVRPKMRDGRSNWCRKCEIAVQREWRQRPGVRERRNELARKRKRSPEAIFKQRLWTWYRLTVARYEELLESQGGRCAICNSDEPGGRGRWHVDHDHSCCDRPRSCGECVRGLLCARCNPMIGMAKDDPQILQQAVNYLARLQ